MKIYKASRRKSGSFEFGFLIARRLGLYDILFSSAHVGGSNLALIRVQIWGLAGLQIWQIHSFFKFAFWKFNGSQAAVKFELAQSQK